MNALIDGVIELIKVMWDQNPLGTAVVGSLSIILIAWRFFSFAVMDDEQARAHRLIDHGLPARVAYGKDYFMTGCVFLVITVILFAMLLWAGIRHGFL